MVSYAPNSLLPRIFDFIISSFREDGERDITHSYVCALADIASTIPTSLFSHVVASLQSIQHAPLRTCTYVALTPFFHSVAMARGSKLLTYDLAINAARSISDAAWRRCAFLSLLPYIPSEDFGEAFTESWEIIQQRDVGWGWFHQYVLVRISPLLPAEFFEPVMDVLDNADNIGPARVAVLDILAIRLLSLPKEIRYLVWNKLLRKFANRGRPNLLMDLAAFLSVIELFNEQEILQRTIKDILEVSTWWQ